MTNQSCRMKALVFFLVTMYPAPLRADAPSPPDTWNLVQNSLNFNVRTIIYPAEGNEDPIPVTPYLTLELYRCNSYRLTAGVRAAAGYRFPHFLPDPPIHEPAPESRAVVAFGYYTLQSDTLRFNAHYLSLFEDGEDLEDVVKLSDSEMALEEYRLVITFVNTIFLEFFNDLYAYLTRDRLVFMLPGDSDFADPSVDSDEQIVWELARPGGPSSISRSAVQATVTGEATAGLTVEFARSVSGRPPQYAWCAVTDGGGRAALDVVTLHGSGVTGYYSARARNEAGGIVGRWHSIPLNEDHRQILELTPGGAARVLASHALYSARIAPPENAQPEAGLAPNFPNPFNSSTLIAYRLADAGPVRLEVFNSLGQHLNTLVDDHQAAGRYVVRWHARDGRGNDVAAGVYLVRLFHPGGVDARRMLYLK